MPISPLQKNAMATNFVELVLTCGSWQEAQRIVDSLLEQKLIACAEFIPIKSKFQWKDSIEEADEIKLIMESAAHLFDEVEAEIKKLHSYETFVLQSLPLERLSQEAAEWWQNALKTTTSATE
jgi:periplasmic divalent cation tolerance protein